MILFN